MPAKRFEKGFTLVELSLAIVFVALLAMAILTTSMQVMKIYSKGTTLKSVDQASRDISDQLTRDLRATPANEVNYSQIGAGRLCIGSIAYLWNTSAVLNGSGVAIKYNNVPVRLTRITDPGHAFCATPLIYTVASSNSPTEFLGSTVNDLAVYSLTAAPFTPTDPLYTISYTLGTNNDQASVTNNSATAQCRPPTDASANFDFCTVSQFNLVVKTSDPGGS